MEPTYFVIEKYIPSIGVWMEIDVSIRPNTKNAALQAALKMKEDFIKNRKDHHDDKSVQFSIVPIYNAKGTREVIEENV